MKTLALVTITASILAFAVAGGCGASEDDSEAGTGAATADDEACKIFIVKDQKFVGLGEFINEPGHPERKNDPVVQKLFSQVSNGGKCPTNYAEIIQADSLKQCNLQGRVVSERSALLNTADVGRALTSRSCGNEPTLFFLLDPVNTNPKQLEPFVKNERALAACKGKAANAACTFKIQPDDEESIAGACTTTGGRTDNITVCLPPAVPTDVEVLGNNTTDGIFSYYAREPQKGPGTGGTAIWKFYGTSADFVTNGYDCDVKKFHGACQSKYAQDNGVAGAKSGARCASCHPGGGMVQKELNSPWSNWMQDPGGYTGAHKDLLGSFQDGDSFEGTTTKLNTKWAQTRAKILSGTLGKDKIAQGPTASVKELLRPVFCTMDINLQGQSFGMNARNDLMIDLAFADAQGFFANPDGFGGTGGRAIAAMDPNNYKAAITANGQFVAGDFGKDASGKDKHPFVDTPHAFMYPERSNLDHQYIAALKSLNLVSEDLIRDILFVDFTRPIFSPTRCSLAELADGITDKAKAKEQLIAKITAKAASATPAEQELLASLQATDAAPRHQPTVDKYLAACKARAQSDNKGFTTDVVNYASHLRRVAKLMKVKLKVEQDELGILDFDETVPRDSSWGSGDGAGDAPVTDPKFDANTCTLGQ